MDDAKRAEANLRGGDRSVTPTKRDVAVAVMDHTFRAARAAIEAFLRSSPLQTNGAAQFATLHLVTRSLGDLGWAQNAATAGFPIQAYSLMRPAWEAINLCDLFAEKPEMADEWAQGEFWKFTPAAVRNQLGSKDDPFYSFMSERSHPRFAGLQMTIFKAEGGKTEPTERQHAILHLNDIPLEVTAAYMAVATPAIILARLTTQAGRLNFENPQHKPDTFAPTIRSVSGALKAVGARWTQGSRMRSTKTQRPADHRNGRRKSGAFSTCSPIKSTRSTGPPRRPSSPSPPSPRTRRRRGKRIYGV